MIRRTNSFGFAIVIAMFLSIATQTRGDDAPPAKQAAAKDPPAKVAPPGGTPPVKLTIYPAPAPRPSLKYHLLPDLKSRIRGNAAVYYGKVTAENNSTFGNRETMDKFERWHETPLADLRKDDANMATDGIENMLYRAARCESCDWQLPIHEEEFYTILLPEVQQTRQFAKILATRARIQIARGEFDGALRTFQSAYAMAQNVAEGETLVNGIVGIAISNILNIQLFEFVQQPKAPNLYWALTTLPRPLVNLRKGVEAELDALWLSFPEVRDLDSPRSPEEWRQTLFHFWEKAVRLADGDDPNIGKPVDLAAASLKEFATAKQALVERGLDPKVVEAMPAAQVVLIHTIRTYEDLRDDRLKWFLVSNPEALRGAEAIPDEPKDNRPRDDEQVEPESNVLAKLLLVASNDALIAAARLEREMAILRVVEALRIYGASHDGHLPQTLADVIEVPVPLDPITGKAFEYRLEVDTATLQVTPLRGRPTTYEIKMARP